MKINLDRKQWAGLGILSLIFGGVWLLSKAPPPVYVEDAEAPQRDIAEPLGQPPDGLVLDAEFTRVDSA